MGAGDGTAGGGGVVLPASPAGRALLASGLALASETRPDPAPSFGSATWAGFPGAVGMSLVLGPEPLALSRCRIIKKIMQLGAKGGY